MMKIKNVIILTIVGVVLLSGVTNAEVQKISVQNTSVDVSDIDINEVLNQINETLIIKYMEEQVAFGPRPTGSENSTKIAEYLYNEFKNMGLHVEYEPFNFLRCKGKNVVATLNGSNPASDAVFIISCHYDTWPGSPGANDDASGCTAVLAIAKIMSQYSFNHTVRFVLFAGHEQGGFGSADYARKCYERGDNIQGLICPGSMGRPAKNANVVQLSKSYRTEWIYQLAKEICENYEEEINLTIEPVPMHYCDNLPFVRYGFSATTLISGQDEIQDHCPEDDLDRVNYSYITRITKMLLLTTIEMANKPIDIQVRFVSPKEGYIYFTDNLKFRHPLTKTLFMDLQGITYLIGNRITAEINITSNEEISSVIYSFDKEVKHSSIQTEPPYDWRIEAQTYGSYPLKGKHTLEVTVTTVTGKTAYDEMDIFII